MSNAFHVLKDADQRSHYDQFGGTAGVAQQNPFGGFRGSNMPFDPDELFAQMFRDNPDIFNGRRRGGGGNQSHFFHFPMGGNGGMPFNFAAQSGGVPFASRAARGGGRDEEEVPLPLLPAPLLAVFKAVSSVVPPPFLILFSVVAFLTIFVWVIGFIFSHLFYVLILQISPLPGKVKSAAWIALFALGFFGYI